MTVFPKIALSIGGAFAAMISYGTMRIANDTQATERSLARQNIYSCIRMMKDRRQEPDKRTATREACKRMKTEFRKRYGREP